MTQVLRCGLIGDNIGNSRLARGLAIMAEDMGGRLEFTAIDTHGQTDFDFAAKVEGLRAAGWTGVTITHPWKTHAARWAGTAMVPEVQQLGAANTLTFDPLRGHNTDYTGFVSAWTTTMAQAPGRVAVAGAGGVARAVIPALLSLGATEIRVWDKSEGAAEALARDTGATAIPMADAADAIQTADGLVNCTPMGMHPYGGSAFEHDLLGGQTWAFDAVYTPTETAFLCAARAAGLTCLTGFDLFRHMAIESFAAYTGHRPDPVATLAKLETLKPE